MKISIHTVLVGIVFHKKSQIPALIENWLSLLSQEAIINKAHLYHTVSVGIKNKTNFLAYLRIFNFMWLILNRLYLQARKYAAGERMFGIHPFVFLCLSRYSSS